MARRKEFAVSVGPARKKSPYIYPDGSVYNHIYDIIPPERYPLWDHHLAVRDFEISVFPSRRIITRTYKALLEVGHPIFGMIYKPIGMDRLVRSVGPLEVLAREVADHPIYLTASFHFYKYPHNSSTQHLLSGPEWQILLQYT